MVKSVARRNNTIPLGENIQKKSHVRELARKKPLRDSQQTKSESNRILAKGDCPWNSSLTGVVPLNSGPSRKTIAMDVVGYLENGRLQQSTFVLARCSYSEERNKKYIQHCITDLFVCFYGIISGQKQLEHFNVILQGRICFTEENFNEFQHSTQYSVVTVFN